MKYSLLILITAIAIGCGGNHASPVASDPVTPDAQVSPTDASTHQSLGYFALVLDKSTLEAELIPLRVAEWHLNVTGILNGTMGVAAAAVPGESDPLNGLFTLDISLTHPFPDKPQFAGFDVRGILMTPGTLPLGLQFFADTDETRLENADGYTRWWNPVEFTDPGIFGYTEGALANAASGALNATVNPYKYFADVFGPVAGMEMVTDEPLDSDEGRGVFSAGSTNTRRYSIRFPLDPGPQIIYGYAVDCSWILPSPNPPEEIPDDFPIEANQPEPYRIDMWTEVNTLYYDTEAGAGGGVLRMRVNVYDWQALAAGDFTGQLTSARIYAPELMSSELGYTLLEETPGKLRLLADLTNQVVPTEAGEALVICRFESADGSTYQQGSAAAPAEPLSAYHAIPVTIDDPECTIDDNNSSVEAVPVDLVDSVIDQLCAPDDEADFYTFTLETGYSISGEIRLYSENASTAIRLLDEMICPVAQANISEHEAIMSLDELNLPPQTYYIQVTTCCNTQVLPYLLEIEASTEFVEPSSSVEVTPPELFCNPSRVYLTQTHTIVTGDWGFWIYDHSDPGNLELVYHEYTAIGNDACVYGNRLYFIDDNMTFDGISLMDLSDPENPVIYEDIADSYYGMQGICMDGTRLYVGTPSLMGTDVIIYDYSLDPMEPALLGTIDNAGGPEKLALINPNGPNRLLVVGNGNDEILVFDVDDPMSVTPAGSITRPPGAFKDMITQLYRVFYTEYNSATLEGTLHALEYNTVVPNDLGEVDSILLPGTGEAIYAWSPNIFVADGEAGLTIINANDPSALEQESNTPLLSEGIDVTVLGDDVYVIPEGAGMQVYDASDPEFPSEQGRLQVVNQPRVALIKDDYLLAGVSDGLQYGIKIVDISDPPNARLANLRQMDETPRGMSMDGNILAVSTNTMVQLWNVHSAGTPEYLSTIFPPASATATGVSGKGLYIATGGNELLVYDISTASTPSLEETQVLTKTINDFTFYSEHMYLACEDGIYYYSLDDAMSPLYLGLYSTPLEAIESVTQAHYLYIVTLDTLEIATLSDPSSPMKIGDVTVDATSDLSQIAVEGYYAYLQGDSSPVHAVYLWPHSSPTLIDDIYTQRFISIFGASSDLLVNDGYLYGTTQYTGIRIHDLY